MLREVAVAAARRAAAGTLGWPGWASSAAVSCLEQGRHLASSSKGQPDDHDELSTSYNSDLSDLQQPGDFAALPPRVHQLIGDPRTGVADDTTTNPFGSVEVEQIWTQDQQELTWYRYTYGAEHMPNMHRDSRLSDHSKNLMYVLRAKDPRRWTIEALARKFGIRRQRVLAILALKEMEGHAIEQGQLLTGPLRPYAFSINLADVHLDPATGEPMDIAEVSVAQQQHDQGSSSPSTANTQAHMLSSSTPSSWDLSEFFDDAPSTSSPSTNTTSGSTPGGWQPFATHGDDLAHAMPQVAAAAQRLQLQLLQLLRRHDYSCDALRDHLLGELAKAEAYYAAHIQGTELEGLVAATAAEGGPAPNAEDGDSDAAAGAAAAAGPAHALDFAGQRRQIEAAVEALRPLLESAGLQEERSAALLAGQLRALLSKHEALPQKGPAAAAAAAVAPATAEPAAAKPPPAEAATAEPAMDEPANAESAIAESAAATAATDDAATAHAASPEAEASGEQDTKLHAGPSGGGDRAAVKRDLRRACASADAAVLARAFNALEFAQRRQLLALAPEARVQLNVRGIDLRAAAEDASYGRRQQQQQQQQEPAAAPAAFPGQVPPLVDAFGFQELPEGDVAALLAAAEQLEEAAKQQRLGLARLVPEGGKSAMPAVHVADVRALRQALHTYQHTHWVYDEVIEQQAAAAVGAAEAPPLPQTQQRRMLRVLKELDPHALEKLAYWENYYKEMESGDPERAKRLRANIQKVLKHLDEESGRQSEFPDLPDDTSTATANLRTSAELMAAFIDTDVAGRKYNRGSGERHHVQLPTYPSFEGYSLKEFERINEGEVSALSQQVAKREEAMMWREFRDKMLYNLGLSGPGLWATQGRAKPQRPQEGWSYVVHPTGRSRKHTEPYVAPPAGAPARPLNEDERLLMQRRTPKPRRRWFYTTRRRGD